jgi:oligoribonuclease NrnB/cAMP/cGMP phosphodiesterase (DHH superfamily)
MKCFYHVDQDGIVSGFYVRKACEQRGLAFEPEDFRKINYGMKFPFHDIKQDEFVFIVDYSIEPEEMWQLLSITKNVFWIDHHQSTIETYKDFKCDVKGIRITGEGISGANLTWLYFKYMCDEDWEQIERADEKYVMSLLREFSKNTPQLAKYTALWDTFSWSKKSEEYVKAFHYAFESYDFDALSPLLNTLNGDEGIYEAVKFIDDMIKDGLSIIEYLAANAEQYLRAYGFETTFERYKVYAINRALINSDFFESIDGSKYDMFIGFSFNGNMWEYQLRSAEQDKVNVCELAVKYGGGGHPNAAGFRSEKYVLGV